MYRSIFVSEIVSFLESRKASVRPQTFAYDTAILISLDRYLAERGYEDKVLSEEILDAWVRSLYGKSKTVKEKVIVIRNFVKYLNGLGNRSFLPDAPRFKSNYIPYIYSDEELEAIFHYADNLSRFQWFSASFMVAEQGSVKH